METKPPSSWRYPAVFAILTVVALIVGLNTTGRVQEVTFVLASIFASLLSVPPTDRPIVARIFAGGVILAVLLAFLYVERHSTAPLPYPRQDGLIADFVSGPGGPARTAMGTQFSIFSDSVWNLFSKIWYERVDGSERRQNGFLRINYQLEPLNSSNPYVGVFADFSFSLFQYDVSRFHRLSMRLRGESSDANGIEVGVILYSANINNVDYAFPVWQVPPQDLRPEWTSVNIPFEEFKRPTYVNYDVRLDPSRVYRLGLIISAAHREAVHGHIDVDDLRFE